MGFDGQELATRWSIVAKLRNTGFSWDIGSYKANGNCSGDVEGLRSYAQALIPVLDMPPSGFPSHASMGDALQAVHKTHEVFGQNSDGAAPGHGEHSQRVLEANVQARVPFRQDACRDRRCCGQEHGWANQPASERWGGTRVHEFLAESWRQLRKQ